MALVLPFVGRKNELADLHGLTHKSSASAENDTLKMSTINI